MTYWNIIQHIQHWDVFNIMRHYSTMVIFPLLFLALELIVLCSFVFVFWFLVVVFFFFLTNLMIPLLVSGRECFSETIVVIKSVKIGGYMFKI